MSNGSQSNWLCRSQTRRLLLIIFTFCAAILSFQYIRLHYDDDDDDLEDQFISSSSSRSSFVNTSSPETTIEPVVYAHPAAFAPPPQNGVGLIINIAQNLVDNNTSTNSPPGFSSPPPAPKLDIPPKMLARKIYNLSEIADLLDQGHRSVRSTPPLWLTKADLQLVHAKSEIEKASSGDHKDADDGLYPSLYHNITRFKRSYELMEKTLKIYIYKEGEKPIFHQSTTLTGTYASEGWFMKILESNKQHNFITRNPDKAHLFYIPFGSLILRTLVPKSPGKVTYINVLKDYINMVSAKYPYWNRTGGADHFFVACQDWFESITRATMPTSIRALCDADIYKSFTFGKDVSLPATMVFNPKNPLQNIGGEQSSNRNILAFFEGRMTGYFRPILMQYWENVDPDIILLRGSPRNGSQAYTSFMKRSKYCICPRGTISFSPRVVEAIYYGCVPLLISDNYIPPFSDVLNWESFTVFMNEKDVPRMKEKLLAIPEERYKKLHARVEMVRQHFLWHPDEPKRYDIFHMILHSIWYNRLFQFQSNQTI